MAKIQIRRDSQSDWTSYNPILAQGELGLDLDNGLIKIGDGIRSWNQLPYLSTGSDGGGVSDPNALKRGDNVSELFNDVGYLTEALQSGDNVSELENDAGYITVAEVTGLQPGDNVSELTNDVGYVKSGDNVSELTNDAGYLTEALKAGDNVSELTNDAGYLTEALKYGDNISELVNDKGYLVQALQPGDNISRLNNDVGYITSNYVTNNAVTSVNLKSGDVVLNTDDISDFDSINKYTTQSDISKLAGIEDNATADQTGAEIKSLYEAQDDTNVFTDAQKQKLEMVTVDIGGGGGSITGAEIKVLYEAEDNTNAFTDAYKAKLNGDLVTSINSKTGSVVLNADDISDETTNNKFVAADDLINLANLENNLNNKADLVDGVLSVDQLPEIAVSEYKGNVSDELEMLSVDGVKGDWVIRNDNSKVYVIIGDDPGSSSSWLPLAYPAGFSGSYDDLTGKPTLGTAASTDSDDYATAAQGLTADSALQSGDNVSKLTNDAGYITAAEATGLQPGDNVSQLVNDAGYVTSALQSGDNVSELTNDAGYVTSALQSGDNVSELVNDAGYLTEALQSGDNVSELTNDAGYLASGDNVSALFNDSGYLTEAIQAGDNVSELVNDAGYLTEALQAGDNVSQLVNDAGYHKSGDNFDSITVTGKTTTSQLNVSGMEYPTGDGSSGQVLFTNGSGQLSWKTPDSELSNITRYYTSTNNPQGNPQQNIAAFIAAKSASGGKVYFPPGEYNFGTSAVTINDSVTIVGDGPKLTNIVFTGPDGFVIDHDGLVRDEIRMRGFKINMSGPTPGNAVRYTSRNDGNTHSVLIEDVSVMGTADAAMKFLNSTFLTCRDVHIIPNSNTITTGIRIEDGPGPGDVTSTNVLINNCVFRNHGTGIEVFGQSEGVSISECQFIANEYGININPDAGKGEPFYLVSGCHFDCAFYGITMKNVLHSKIFNNDIRRFSENDWTGIIIDVDSQAGSANFVNQISGNTLTMSQPKGTGVATGIHLKSTRFTTVTNNMFHDVNLGIVADKTYKADGGDNLHVWLLDNMFLAVDTNYSGELLDTTVNINYTIRDPES